jgi:hypothetical protein
MRRLLTPDGTVGPSTCVFPNPAELTVRDDVGVGGALRCEASGLRPQ